LVTQISAIDPDDKKATISYAIIDGDGLGLFSIDSEGI
jgi:hypothetical protein